MPPQARESTSWLRLEWSLRPVAPLTTNLPDVIEELFTILRYVAEVPEEGIRVAKGHSPGLTDQEAKRCHEKARAFIRQAENFYRAGRRTPYRSSALLYYYAFLNLAKSALEVRGAAYDPHHGLAREDDAARTEVAAQAVRVRPPGVFPAFYEMQSSQAWPNTARPTIGGLLAYTSDISYQYVRAGLGDPAICIPCRIRALVNERTREAWLLLAVSTSFDFSTLPNPYRTRVFDVFEEVELDKGRAREQFGIFAEERVSFRFFQQRMPLPIGDEGFQRNQLVEPFRAALSGLLSPQYIENTYDFVLTKPLESGGTTTPVNELTAIYLVMFYLGSLVRYRPDYLDDLLGTKSAWLIESFVTSSPLLALRAFTSEIAGTVYVFNK